MALAELAQTMCEEAWQCGRDIAYTEAPLTITIFKCKHRLREHICLAENLFRVTECCLAVLSQFESVSLANKQG